MGFSSTATLRCVGFAILPAWAAVVTPAKPHSQEWLCYSNLVQHIRELCGDPRAQLRRCAHDRRKILEPLEGAARVDQAARTVVRGRAVRDHRIERAAPHALDHLD